MLNATIGHNVIMSAFAIFMAKRFLSFYVLFRRMRERVCVHARVYSIYLSCAMYMKLFNSTLVAYSIHIVR